MFSTLKDAVDRAKMEAGYDNEEKTIIRDPETGNFMVGLEQDLQAEIVNDGWKLAGRVRPNA
jgi:hypothetical protein